MKAFFTAALTLIAITAPSQAAVLGDVDGSGVVDFGDIITATVGYTGPGGVAFQGDADGDLDVDDEDFLIIISEQTAQSPGPGFVYKLIYDPADGSLSIDTMGGTLNGYALKSGAFNGGNHVPFVLGTFSSLGGVLSESNPFGGVSGSFDLGAVLSPGLDDAGFANAVTTANYTTGLGQPLASFDLVVAPEPSSLAMLGITLLGLSRKKLRA